MHRGLLLRGGLRVKLRGPPRTLMGCRWLTGDSKTPVGFVGLGQMGSRMALNLLNKSGRPLIIYDVNPGACAALKEHGAKVASSMDQLMESTDTIITMLPATVHVRDVMERVIFPKAQKGTLLIDSSTIDPVVSKELNEEASGAGLRMVDAPVSGGVRGAELGTLTFMVGGSVPNVEAAKKLLVHMGRNVVHCGGAGMGCIAKICNNLILGVNMAAVAEAMLLGKKLGIDPKLLNDVLNTSSARSWVTEIYNPCPGVLANAPASKGFTGGFASKWMQKDLWIANEAARSANSPLPMGGLVHQVYTMMSQAGYDDKDFSAIFEYIDGKRPVVPPKSH